jgi:hypothetical protein
MTDSTPRRCRTCGNSGYAPRGEHYKCPYTAIHRSITKHAVRVARDSRLRISLLAA